jgi:hypothetical protein
LAHSEEQATARDGKDPSRCTLCRHALPGGIRKAAPDSEEAERLRDEIDNLIAHWASLRIDYERLIDEAATHRAPAPPKWPDPPDPDAKQH